MTAKKFYKKRAVRFPVHIEAELKSENRVFAAFVGNMSEGGACLITSPLKDREDYHLDETFTLTCELPSSRPVSLSCKIRWYHGMRQGGATKKTGVRFINPPPDYLSFIRSQ